MRVVAFLVALLVAATVFAREPKVQPSTRTQVGATARMLEWNQAGRPVPTGTFARQPAVVRLLSWLHGFPVGRRRAQISKEVDRLTKVHGTLTRLRESEVRDHLLLRAEKAVALESFPGRTVENLTEGFVDVADTTVRVPGKDAAVIKGRRLFYELWRPTGPSKGKVVVISPGFQETGRNFREQAHLLVQQGYDVVLMDHQWAGHSTLNRGGLDRGFGVARDVAAMGIFGRELAQKLHGPSGDVVLFGNSMGAGPGVLGALALSGKGLLKVSLSAENVGARNDEITVAGGELSGGTHAVLQAPFLARKPGPINASLALLGRRGGFLKEWAAPALGVPILARNRVASAKFAQHAARENIGAKLRTMVDADADLETMDELIGQGAVQGKVYVIHGSGDTLAHVKASRKLVGRLDGRGKLDEVPTKDHVLGENPEYQGRILNAMKWIEGG